MKNKNILVFLIILLGMALVVNSCKKADQGAIQSLFTGNTWQLASVTVTRYLGSSQLSYDTLNTTCDTTQLFTFPTGNTCTYTNYHCVHQSTAAGTWALSKDQLFLMANIAVVDTLPGDSTTIVTHPFLNTKILSVGFYSMTLQTGDIGTYYTSTTRRTIYQYGFVKIKTAAGK